MEQPFHGLTPAQAELLYLLSEELGEAQQMIGKILRHGYESYNPHDKKKTTNRGLLERELGDVTAAMSMLRKAGEIDIKYIIKHRREKLLRVKQYLHHN